MAIQLTKGQRINLTKNDGTSLTHITIGLGWDPVQNSSGGFFSSLFGSSAQDIDCDASVFLLQNGKLLHPDDIVYFGHLKHRSGAVIHTGDNLTGEGDGDDETILTDLSKVPKSYDRLIFVVNIYQARSRKQDFGQIQNAYIRILDAQGKEFCRYNLSENYHGMTAMIFGEIYRKGDTWKFNAIGKGTHDGSISELAQNYQ